MMSVLAALVAVTAALCLLDLLLTFGVIRRLREHERRLADIGAPPRRRLEPGSPIGPFTATTTDGALVSGATLPAGAVVAFFSPTCAPCAEQLPRFVDFAATLPGGPKQAFAVVCGDLMQADPLVAKLEPVAQVLVEDSGGPLAAAFGVFAFPTLYVVDGDGTIRANGGSVDVLRAAVAGGEVGEIVPTAAAGRAR
jgi:hypothetical protein